MYKRLHFIKLKSVEMYVLVQIKLMKAGLRETLSALPLCYFGLYKLAMEA